MSHRPLPFLTRFPVVIPTAVDGVCEFSMYHNYFIQNYREVDKKGKNVAPPPSLSYTLPCSYSNSR